ncbi:MAG: methionyl-tRNA formyltransferase [Clostridium sp.]|nr:methionyl-tRNA formyltransferase [Clostridium sp.]
MRIVFMGTPDFAVGALEALIKAGHEITAVVTQPDKAKGRSGQLQFPPVKECALKYGIPVFQPQKIKAEDAVARLKEYPADVYIVAAFGQILSREILALPKFGCLNIHASLLPKYRGASPIQNAIIDGEKQTGITIMQMDTKLDTGDILYQKSMEIDDEDTSATLHDKLMELGGEAITEALPLLEAGKLVPVRQDDALSCYASLIEKSMGEIDFTKSAAELDCFIRGMTPWPSAYTYYRGKQLKIWKALPVMSNPAVIGDTLQSEGAKTAGTVTAVAKDHIRVAAGEGFLDIYELQLEGKKRMSAHDFLLGVKMTEGEKLGQV